MNKNIKLGLVSVVLVAAIGWSIPPASAHDTDCIDYKLLFTDGHGVEGTKCVGDNPDLHVPGIDITCKDKFKDGKIDGVTDHTIGAFYIVNHDKNKDTVCGEDFDLPSQDPTCDQLGLAVAVGIGGLNITVADASLATSATLHKLIEGGVEVSLGPVSAVEGVPLYTDLPTEADFGKWFTYRLEVSAPFDIECSVEVFMPDPREPPTCDQRDYTVELLPNGTVAIYAATPPLVSDIYRTVGGDPQELLAEGVPPGSPLYIDQAPGRGFLNVYVIVDVFEQECEVEIDVPADLEIPCEALDLAATVLLDGSVLLTFNAVELADVFAIGRATGDADFDLLAILPANATLYQDNETVRGEVYRYAVAIVIGETILSMCELEAVEIPEEPEPTCDDIGLSAQALDGGSIRLTWDVPDDARGVILLRDDVQLTIITNGTEEYLDGTAVIDETYTYTLEVYYPGDARGEPTLTCHVEAASVPVFGSALATGLAVSLGLLGYLGARRRT